MNNDRLEPLSQPFRAILDRNWLSSMKVANGYSSNQSGKQAWVYSARYWLSRLVDDAEYRKKVTLFDEFSFHCPEEERSRSAESEEPKSAHEV